MAGPKSKRHSRKRRHAGSAPRAVPSQRREQRAQRRAGAAREQPTSRPSRGELRGERPPSPFGGLPVSELAIFVGAVALIVGWVQGGEAALIVGFVVCALGVAEVTGREHFSGYRSHAALLAAIPSVGLEVVLAKTLGTPHQRGLLLVPVVPVFAVLFLLLRKRFQTARQARVARSRGG